MGKMGEIGLITGSPVGFGAEQPTSMCFEAAGGGAYEVQPKSIDIMRLLADPLRRMTRFHGEGALQSYNIVLCH